VSEKNFKYKAFISYSHQDRKWGDWLHKALETYTVPKGLGEKFPKKLFPIFRDREELPSSAELGEVINQAIKDSSHLIVICSPRSAQSMWVNEEIMEFKRLGRSGKILCLIIDGEPNSEEKPHIQAEECFPKAIRFKIDGNGNLSSQRTEPIAADARSNKDGKKDALLKLIAGLLGIGFDKLKQRELVRKQNRLIAFTALSVCLVGMMSALTFWALLKEEEANLQRMEAVKAQLAEYDLRKFAQRERNNAEEELEKTHLLKNFLIKTFRGFDSRKYQKSSFQQKDHFREFLLNCGDNLLSFNQTSEEVYNINLLLGSAFASLNFPIESSKYLQTAFAQSSSDSGYDHFSTLSKNGPFKAKKVRITNLVKDGVLNLLEIEAWNQNKTINFAASSNVWQSSTASGGLPTLAIDGNKTGILPTLLSTHTSSECNPWIELDFETEKNIRQILLFCQPNQSEEQSLKNFQVEAFDKKDNLIWIGIFNTEPFHEYTLELPHSFDSFSDDEKSLLKLHLKRRSAPEGQVEILLKLAEAKVQNLEIEEGKILLQETLEKLKDKYGKDHLLVGKCLWLLGDLAVRQCDHDEGYKVLKEAREILSKILPIDHYLLINIEASIGDYFRHINQYKKASQHLTKALEKTNQSSFSLPMTNATIHLKLGILNFRMKNNEGSLEHFKEAVDITVEYYGKEHPFLLSIYKELTKYYSNKRDYETAIEYLDLSVQNQTSHYPRNLPKIAELYHSLAHTYDRSGNDKMSMKSHQLAVDLLIQEKGYFDPRVADMYFCMGSTYGNLGNSAKFYYSKCLEIREKVLPKKHPKLAQIYEGVALCHHNSGKIGQSIKYYKKALEVYEKDSPQIPWIYFYLGRNALKMGNQDLVNEFFTKAKESSREIHGENSPHSAQILKAIESQPKVKAHLGAKFVMEEGKLKVLSVHNSNKTSSDGLLPGDFIQTFNGRPVTSLKLLSDEVESMKIGKRVSAEILRNGKLIKLYLPMLKGYAISPDHR
jgi:tetratricopeptide (TPR) repeat protein